MEKALEENTTLQELTVIIGRDRVSAQFHRLLESVFASGTLQTLCLKGVIGEYDIPSPDICVLGLHVIILYYCNRLS